jgi:methionyl-tRNA formyltransferase
MNQSTPSVRGRVVIIAGPGEPTHIVYHALHQAIGVQRIIIEEPVGAKQLLRRRIEKLGLPTVTGQVLFKVLIEKALKLRSQSRLQQIKAEAHLNDSPIPSSEVIHVPSINSPEAIAELQALNPDVVVVQGTRIISKKVLQSVSCPFINTHAGITPRYRGVHGGYWALASDDLANCGVSVHLVDAGIDTGGVIAQARIQPTAQDNFVTYPLLQMAAGLPLLIQAVRDALTGTVLRQSTPESPSRLWSHPTLMQYLSNWRRLGTK